MEDFDYYLEYDIVVKPGADPNQVKFAYQGVRKLEMTPAAHDYLWPRPPGSTGEDPLRRSWSFPSNTSPYLPPGEWEEARTSLPEDTSTTPRLKVADVVVTDDALGVNDLSLSGADAALFEIDGSELYLKTGAVLDYETNPVLDVTVAVDDTTVGGTPDDTASLAISVTIDGRIALE